MIIKSKYSFFVATVAYPENNPFDDNQDMIAESIDPTKHEFDAEQWCRRVTAGIGMPGWTMNNNSSYMLEHVNKIGAAQNYLDNYTGFTYWAPAVNGNLLDGPNFNNDAAWKGGNPYSSSSLIGQCTWFAWGRFYDIYGFSPGFTGNGNQCVSQLLAAHPDKFEASDTPKPGSVFSTSGPTQYGHVGIVVDVRGDILVIEEIPEPHSPSIVRQNLGGVRRPGRTIFVPDSRCIVLRCFRSLQKRFL